MADSLRITGEKEIQIVSVGTQGPAGPSGSSVPATNSTLGGVIVGSGLVVDSNGTISVSTSYIQDEASNGTLTITGDSGATTADLLSETTGSHYQSTVNNSGTWGFNNWYLKSSEIDPLVTWGGFGVNSSLGISEFYFNYAPNFNTGLSYGRGVRVSGSDIVLFETSTGGATVPAKVWTANSVLTKNYADAQYLTTANLTGYATLASPSLTGTPTAPTASGGTNTTQIATTAFVASAVGEYLTTANASTTYQPISGMSVYLTTATAATTYLTQNTAASVYAPIANPTFTGNVTIPANASISGYLTTANATSTYTPLTRTIAAGTGLAGGGDLSANRTLSLAASGITAGSYGGGSAIPILTVDAYGRITAASTSTVYPDWTNISGRPTMTDYLTVANATFANITAKPTTLSGYGITDGITANTAASTYATITSAANATNLSTGTLSTARLGIAVDTLSGTSVTWAASTVKPGYIQLTAATTINAPTGLITGATYALIIKQGASAAYAVTWNSIFKWAGGTAPTLSATANAIDVLTFIYDGTNLYGTAQKAFA